MTGVEYLEVTPKSIRMRKILLDENERLYYANASRTRGTRIAFNAFAVILSGILLLAPFLMEPRDKRDLPEVVAEILIEQHAMREEIAAMRTEIRDGSAALRQEISESGAALRLEIRTSHQEMVGLFNGMTNAILDAMNRGTDRYDGTAQEVNQLKNRVARLENPATDAA